MKLSCLPVSYFGEIISGRMSIEQWASQASDLGLDAIDLSVVLLKSRDRAYLKSMRESIEAAGMRVAVMNTYPDFTHPDPAVRKEEQSQLRDDITAASLLGAQMIRVTAGQAHPQTRRQDGVAWAIDGLVSSTAAADRCGVKLLYENHSKPGVWDYPDFSLPSDIFLEIAEAVRGTSISVLFDTANPLVYGDDPLPLLEQVFEQVECIHAADTGVKGKLEPVAIGTGVVPFNDIFAMLIRSGYDGWISIEEASGLGALGVAGAVTFVRNAWAEATMAVHRKGCK